MVIAFVWMLVTDSFEYAGPEMERIFDGIMVPVQVGLICAYTAAFNLRCLGRDYRHQLRAGIHR